MSFDVDIVIDAGGEWPAVVEVIGKPTDNISPMFDLALGEDGLRGLDGSNCAEAIGILEAADSHVNHPDNLASYEWHNPANGWGCHGTAKNIIRKLLAACRDHPEAFIRVT